MTDPVPDLTIPRRRTSWLALLPLCLVWFAAAVPVVLWLVHRGDPELAVRVAQVGGAWLGNGLLGLGVSEPLIQTRGSDQIIVELPGIRNPADAVQVMQKTALLEIIDPAADRALAVGAPGEAEAKSVIVVGVNGVGKTTTVGKLARVLVADEYSVVLGAADTFRAAAADQLETWGARVGVPVERFQYLLLMAACLLVTAPLEWVLGARVYRRPRRLALALAPAFGVFVAWDLWASATDTWGFDERYTIGVQLPGGMAIEELVFFLVVPVCGLLSLEAVRNVLAGTTPLQQRWRRRRPRHEEVAA